MVDKIKANHKILRSNKTARFTNASMVHTDFAVPSDAVAGVNYYMCPAISIGVATISAAGGVITTVCQTDALQKGSSGWVRLIAPTAFTDPSEFGIGINVFWIPIE